MKDRDGAFPIISIPSNEKINNSTKHAMCENQNFTCNSFEFTFRVHFFFKICAYYKVYSAYIGITTNNNIPGQW